jgi:hypothetical protein
VALIDIGTIRAINRYPVKSMAGENLAAATLRWPGIDGDRQYAFYRADNTSRFPWLTGRDVASLVVHAARYLDPADPRRSPVRVTALDGREHDVGDPALCAALGETAGEPVAGRAGNLRQHAGLGHHDGDRLASRAAGRNSG